MYPGFICKGGFVRFKRYQSHLAIEMMFLILLVFFDGSPVAPSHAQANDADGIRKQVGRIFELYQQKDFDRLTSLWSEKSPFIAENKKLLREEFTAYEKIVVNDFDIRELEIEGEL